MKLTAPGKNRNELGYSPGQHQNCSISPHPTHFLIQKKRQDKTKDHMKHKVDGSPGKRTPGHQPEAFLWFGSRPA